jgi:ABC-type branched-subunit amino acid transport system ATPase component
MSIKPPLIDQEAVVEQVKLLKIQKSQMEVELEQLENKLRSIEASLAENDRLRTRNQTLLDQVMTNFDEEWKRRAEFFPDLHRRVLEAAASLVAPPKP